MARYHVLAEIESQPSCWREAAARAGDVRDALPRAGERVAVFGCGTSLFMARAYAARREARGLGVTDAFAASELPFGRDYDRYIAISRSGTTTEVLRALERLPGSTVITALADAPVPAGTRTVLLDFADERSVVQTRFATSALVLLCAAIGDAPPVADGERAVAEPLPSEWLAVEQITYLGHGWTNGLAEEAALKAREAARLWTEAYPAMEYRHGPISITGPGRAVWSFGPLPEGLAENIARVGGHLEPSPLADPLADLIRAQRLAVAIAEAKGCDPDRPRNLTRSVVLS